MTNGVLDSGQKIVTNGLVLNHDIAQLRSYPTTGTTITDLSGNSNTGTLINGVGFNSGNGGILVFDGVNDYSDLGILNYTNFSLSIWVKTQTTVLTAFIGKLKLSASKGRVGIYYSTGAPNKARFIIELVLNSPIVLSSTSNVNDNNWHLITSTVNRNGNVTLYFDGLQESFADISSLSGVDLTLNEQFRIGTYPDSGGTPLNFLNGSISNYQIYNKELSATEVMQNYNAIKSRYGL